MSQVDTKTMTWRDVRPGMILVTKELFEGDKTWKGPNDMTFIIGVQRTPRGTKVQRLTIVKMNNVCSPVILDNHFVTGKFALDALGWVYVSG